MLGEQNGVYNWDYIHVLTTFFECLILYLLVISLVVAKVLITVLFFK
jgi:hypothetical protein